MNNGKGGVISEGVLNVVPSSKKTDPNNCPSAFSFWLKR